MPTVGFYGVAVSYKRGAPVGGRLRALRRSCTYSSGLSGSNGHDPFCSQRSINRAVHRIWHSEKGRIQVNHKCWQNLLLAEGLEHVYTLSTDTPDGPFATKIASYPHSHSDSGCRREEGGKPKPSFLNRDYFRRQRPMRRKLRRGWKGGRGGSRSGGVFV